MYDGPNAAPRPARPAPTRAAVRHLHPRAVLRHPLRVLRLQHLHARRTGRREPRRLAGGAARRAGAGRRSSCGSRQVDTVFVGGGTPSLLGAAGLRRCSTRSASTSSSRPDAEVTTEANPESTSPQLFDRAARRPATRGCRSACSPSAPHVLAVLDRVHSPGRALAAAREARAAGLRARQPRPHLRHAGGDRRRPVALRRRRDRRRRRPRLGLRAGGRGRHRAGAAGAPRRDRRRPTTTCLPAATSCSTPGCRRPASTGTRCPTGAGPAASAGTTSATGTAASGGAPARARTATSMATRWWNVKHPNAYAQSLADGRLPVADFERLDAAARCTPRT